MKTKGQFILLTVDEFKQWLGNTQFSREIWRVQNHHTLAPRYTDFDGSNHFPLLEGMKSWHVQHNGWADIGQNITTFPDGTLAICRSFEKVPACILGQNAGAICIENLGNFDAGKDKMTPAQRDAIIQVNALLCREFKLAVNTDTIVYHHWFDLSTGKRNNGNGSNVKTCPGTTFFGGNRVEDCKANFLPLIAAALDGHIAAPPAVIPLGKLKVVSSDGLTVRGAPKVSGSPLGTLPNGSIVQIFQAEGIWRKIDPVEQRWVSSKFLAPA
jgi:hypothetical protein